MPTIEYINRATGQLEQERPPAEGMLKFLYQNPLGRWTLLSLVKRKFISSLYGRNMDKPKSRHKIKEFVANYKINMSEAVKNIEEFTSFNDFFYRRLKPEARPIGEGFVSPADGKLLAFECIEDVKQFYVKGQEFTLERYLKNKELAAQYKNASMLIIRLAPHDYHRFHFPYAGTPKAAQAIEGYYYSVSPHAVIPDFAKVFCENKREYVLLDTADKGQVLLSPVGATMVGSIIETYTPDQAVNKGDEMGYFAFGGSTVLVLIDRSKISIDADLLENTRKGRETAVVMGERIGG